ncbi:hypothetical protein [uncultured Brachyspira sp.]|uniref:hypothetical protein n=2 Tax=Brachyspira TaxID=29521 RepID=UPI0026097067|nr:hypothetical protein [uncultured Brachyspira sp.]
MSDEDYKIYKDHNCARYFYVTVSALNCISNYISYLKENNVYDNTKIILVSDHATPIKSSLFKNDDLEFATGVNAVLIYKDFNSRGEVKIDTNFSTIADLHYLATKHIENVINFFAFILFNLTHQQKFCIICNIVYIVFCLYYILIIIQKLYI